MKNAAEKKQYIISMILAGVVIAFSLPSMINIDGKAYNAFQLVKAAKNGNIPA